MTQLLVSVRNVQEAFAAVAGGADIIDVKEPLHGSLGCAAPNVIREIALALKDIPQPSPPLSLALGELSEWSSSPTGPQIGIENRPVQTDTLRAAIQFSSPMFLKLGLAGSLSTPAPSSWIAELQQVQQTIPGPHSWVAVAYADHSRAAAPTVTDVLEAAIESNVAIMLVDTHTKDGTTLSDHLTFTELQNLRQLTEQHGLKLALAGRVTINDLPQLLNLQPDIIAVRGAVCEEGNRTATVSQALVREFHQAMRKLK